MKKYLFLATIFMISLATRAQEDMVIKASVKTTKEATPKQIIDSLKKRFPDARAVEYYRSSPAAIKSGWKISEEDNLDPGEDLEYYTLAFKRSDFQYYGLFRADGSLVRSKFQQSGVHLPEAVKTSLRQLAGKDYKDYTILSKTIYKTVDDNNRNEYYQVTAVKKDDQKIKKTVTLDPDGTVINVK